MLDMGRAWGRITWQIEVEKLTLDWHEVGSTHRVEPPKRNWKSISNWMKEISDWFLINLVLSIEWNWLAIRQSVPQIPADSWIKGTDRGVPKKWVHLWCNDSCANSKDQDRGLFTMVIIEGPPCQTRGQNLWLKLIEGPKASPIPSVSGNVRE